MFMYATLFFLIKYIGYLKQINKTSPKSDKSNYWLMLEMNGFENLPRDYNFGE